MREAFTGGLSIVFTRMAVSGVTKICPNQVENPETCQQILGVDSNSLYLASISGKCQTSFFCVYSEENNFSPDFCSKYGLSSLQWLSYISVYNYNYFNIVLECAKNIQNNIKEHLKM